MLGGQLTAYAGVNRNGIARVDADGSLDTTFNPGLGTENVGGVSVLALQGDGKILIGGSLTSYNGVSRNGIARVNTDGSLDTSFSPGTGANSTVSALALQTDGKILLGGSFTAYNGVNRNFIARIATDGSLDPLFDPGVGPSNSVNAIAVQTDGMVVLGGSFATYNAVARSNIARVNADGSLDSTFNPGTGGNGTINTLAIQTSGKILLGGVFTSYNSVSRGRIASINNDGSLDTSFSPGTGASSSVSAVIVQTDGKILLGGAFTSYNGVSRSRIARVNSDGSLDLSFNPGTGASSSVSALAMQSDGKILIGGAFTGYNGVTRNRIARINSDGNLDISFNPGTGANGTVSALAVQVDGKVLLGGAFTSYHTSNRNGVARLFSNVPIPPPANDNFVNAQVITGASGNVTGTSFAATKEAGEPNHAGYGGGSSVWYRWQAPATGPVNFNTLGSNFDTSLAVYTGTSVSGLTQIAANDDSGGFLQSSVTFTAEAGVVYQIAVDGFSGVQGSIVLTWSQSVPTPTPTPSPTVALTPGVPQTGSIPAPQPGFGSLGETQYTIEVPSGVSRLKIGLIGNQGGDVDLHVRFGQRVTIENGATVADYRSESPLKSETVIIASSSSPRSGPEPTSLLS